MSHIILFNIVHTTDIGIDYVRVCMLKCACTVKHFARDLISLVMKISEIKYPQKFKFNIDSNCYKLQFCIIKYLIKYLQKWQ